VCAGAITLSVHMPRLSGPGANPSKVPRKTLLSLDPQSGSPTAPGRGPPLPFNFAGLIRRPSSPCSVLAGNQPPCCPAFLATPPELRMSSAPSPSRPRRSAKIRGAIAAHHPGEAALVSEKADHDAPGPIWVVPPKIGLPRIAEEPGHAPIATPVPGSGPPPMNSQYSPLSRSRGAAFHRHYSPHPCGCSPNNVPVRMCPGQALCKQRLWQNFKENFDEHAMPGPGGGPEILESQMPGVFYTSRIVMAERSFPP